MIARSLLIIGIIIVLITQYACHSTKSLTSSINKEAVINDEKMLIGPVDEKGFQQDTYAHWYDSTYSAYVVKQSILDKVGDQLNDVSIMLYLGTWCSDSRREVPAFYKILNSLNYIQQNLSVYALDRSKTYPGESIKEYNIEYVPTFIFYRNKKEIGRIIESPSLSLEEDILTILSK